MIGLLHGRKNPVLSVDCVYPLDPLPAGMGYRTLVSLRRALVRALEEGLPGIKIKALELDKIDVPEVVNMGRSGDKRSEAAQTRSARNQEIFEMARGMAPGGAIDEAQADRIGNHFNLKRRQVQRIIATMLGQWTSEGEADGDAREISGEAA